MQLLSHSHYAPVKPLTIGLNLKKSIVKRPLNFKPVKLRARIIQCGQFLINPPMIGTHPIGPRARPRIISTWVMIRDANGSNWGHEYGASGPGVVFINPDPNLVRTELLYPDPAST